MMNLADPQQISATTPDWTREARQGHSWDPPRALLKSIRDYQRAAERGSKFGMKLAVVRHRFWSMVTGADIPVNCRLGGGLLIPHPNGIVIHPDVEIGPNCLLFQQVTLGHAPSGLPQIGGHVDIGAGAKVIGAVTVGDHAKVGANAVVTKDVPAGATVVGNPARIVNP
jgi:serine O-acetyltransferase